MALHYMYGSAVLSQLLAPRKVELPVLERPRTRGECVDGPRPCPWETCRYHLGATGRHRVNFAGTPGDASASCALDHSDQEHTLQEVALLLELGPQRTQQIEAAAVAKLKKTRFGRELLEQLNRRR